MYSRLRRPVPRDNKSNHLIQSGVENITKLTCGLLCDLHMSARLVTSVIIDDECDKPVDK